MTDETGTSYTTRTKDFEDRLAPFFYWGICERSSPERLVRPENPAVAAAVILATAIVRARWQEVAKHFAGFCSVDLSDPNEQQEELCRRFSESIEEDQTSPVYDERWSAIRHTAFAGRARSMLAFLLGRLPWRAEDCYHLLVERYLGQGGVVAVSLSRDDEGEFVEVCFEDEKSREQSEKSREQSEIQNPFGGFRIEKVVTGRIHTL